MINLFEGRKHLGPLDWAQINCAKNQENFVKALMLDDIISQLQETEEELQKEHTTQADIVMLQLLKAQLNKHLYDFLGVPHDSRTSEDSQISD